MAALTIYPTPLESLCTLTHDSGFVHVGVVSNDANGRACQVFDVPLGIPDGWGCALKVEHENKVPFDVRGLLVKDYVTQKIWHFFLDDMRLQDVPPPVEIPVPVPPPSGPTPTTPLGIIKQVYATGDYDLSTKQGCGMFIEECCAQCHDHLSPSYGHIRKTGAQNNYNGHAVDAFQLLSRDGETKAGIYDCITSSESSDARPAFNYVGEPRPDLWYYPA